MSESREPSAIEQLNLFIAEHVIGLRVVVVQPSWYDRPVFTFFETGYPLMVYAWDTNACNAQMFRNGVDASDGHTECLPNWVGEETEGYEWAIVSAMIERGYVCEVRSFKTSLPLAFTPADILTSETPIPRVAEYLAHEAEFMPLGSDHSERYIERDGHPSIAIGLAARRAIEGKLKPKDYRKVTKCERCGHKEPEFKYPVGSVCPLVINSNTGELCNGNRRAYPRIVIRDASPALGRPTDSAHYANCSNQSCLGCAPISAPPTGK